jgi:nucleoside-diphosphate-sugar epimerase
MQKLLADKILVTGAAGFIGSHIVEEAIKQGISVVGVDNLVAGKLDNLQDALRSPLFEFRQANVQHDLRLPALYPDVQVIFHNAASKCTVCRVDPAVDLMSNALGTLRIAEAAMKMGAHLVHASTGSTNRGNPKSFYGVSKLAAENYLRVLGSEGLEYSCLRYHHVFGPRQPYDDLGGVIPIFIRNVLFNQPIQIHGLGTQTRYFTYVDDVVKANFILANSLVRNSIMDVASERPTTIGSLAVIIRRMVGKPHHEIEYTSPRLSDIEDFIIDRDPITRLGWYEDDTFEDNLTKTIKWYRRLLL